MPIVIMYTNNFSWHLFIKYVQCDTVEPVVYGHFGTNQKHPDYQGVQIFQVSLYDKAPFGTITKSVDYSGILIFKCRD